MSQTRILTLAAVTLPLLLGACELGPKTKSQGGFRGTGINQIGDKDNVLAQTVIPANAYATPDDSGPRAGATYQNVQVLAGVSTERFNHLMAQMNNWVVPAAGLPESEAGCNYCHNPNNMASDEKYTKVVARRMIQMTQNINANWTDHVQQTGVTCWTCHRGNAVPNYRWVAAAPGGIPGTITGNKRGQNTPDPAVAYASLPYDPFSTYLKDDGVNNIRVASSQVHPSPDHVVSVKEAEKTYGLMMHLSKGLGVNCTYCHNTASFRAWNMSSAQRATAWYGLRMVAKTNAEYITPLASVFPAVHINGVGPAERKGPMGDAYKINCATCHNGLNKPMNGVSMRADNPVLWGAALAPVAATMMAPKADPNATAASCDADFAKALTGKTVEFDTGAATIRSTSTPLLDGLVQIAGRCSAFKMSVEGHTDATGNAAANIKLSQARADAVDKYLSERGVAAAQLVATGYGQTRPLDTSGTPAGNQRNRRIEINVGAAGGGTSTGR
jgi:photosynthetic reaction center cytochrome c subunit